MDPACCDGLESNFIRAIPGIGSPAIIHVIIRCRIRVDDRKLGSGIWVLFSNFIDS
jgi:hypothetical protein